MTRKTDSRASAGQRLEDEADAITDEVRRQTVQWSERLMRGHPGSTSVQAAIVYGLIGGVMDILFENVGPDIDKVERFAKVGIDAYVDAWRVDRKADAQENSDDS